METEAPAPPRTLELAWARVANLDAVFIKRTAIYYRARRWRALLAVLMTFFAILSQSISFAGSSLVGLIVKVLFIATPVTATILAVVSNFENVSLMRNAAEQIEKEIYLYRTVHKRNPKRSQLLEKRLGTIQEQLYKSLRGEIPPLDQYQGKLPPYYYPQDPGSDPGFSDLTGDEYSKYRLERMLFWYNRQIPRYQAERRQMTLLILALGSIGSVLAALGGTISIWVALIGLIILALFYWQDSRNLDVLISSYSNLALELSVLYDHWLNLEPEERTEKEFHEMVLACENILAKNRLEMLNTRSI